VLGAFNSLPPWIQTAVLTGWGLNKLTGGALGNIAGILTRSAFGALRGATPANPVFVADVAGGAGAGGGAAVAGRSLLGTAAKFVLGPAAAIFIGKEIAQAINAPVIGPAKEFEQREVTAVLEGGNAREMVRALGAIEGQLNTSDVGAQTALIASRIPFIGDALGNVAGTLEEQRDQLRDQLSAQGYTNQQIDAMVAAALQGNTLTADQSLAIVRESRDMTRHIDAGASGTRKEMADVRRVAAEHKALTERVRADAASSDRALLGSLSTQLSVQRAAGARDAVTAARTSAHLAAIERVDGRTAAASEITSRKNFSPTLNFRADVLANISVSATQIQRSLSVRTSASQTTFTGRGGDTRF
jgi:hypothetical protein